MRLFRTLLPALAITLMAISSQAQNAARDIPLKPLSPQARKIIASDIVSSYQIDNKFALEIALKKLAARTQFDQIPQVNKLLSDNALPSLESLFVVVRQPKIPYSPESAAPASSKIELRLVAQGLQKYMSAEKKRVRKLVEVKDPSIPDTYQKFEDRLNLHELLDGNLASLQQTEKYLERFLDRGKKDFRKYIESLPEKDLLATRKADSEDLNKLRVTNIENALRLRIFRMENAISDLDKPGVDEKTRIEAALVLAVDATKVPQQLKEYGPHLNHPDLKDAELPEFVHKMLQESLAKHIDEVLLASNLYSGMQYWLAGRHGYASSFQGLVKLPYTFTQTTEDGELYMPLLPYSQAANRVSATSDIRPLFERRHLYLHRYPMRSFDCDRYVQSTHPISGTAKRKKSTPKSNDDPVTKGYFVKPAAAYTKKAAKGYFGKAAKPYFGPPAPPYFIEPVGVGMW